MNVNAIYVHVCHTSVEIVGDQTPDRGFPLGGNNWANNKEKDRKG